MTSQLAELLSHGTNLRNDPLGWALFAGWLPTSAQVLRYWPGSRKAESVNPYRSCSFVFQSFHRLDRYGPRGHPTHPPRPRPARRLTTSSTCFTPQAGSAPFFTALGGYYARNIPTLSTGLRNFPKVWYSRSSPSWGASSPEQRRSGSPISDTTQPGDRLAVLYLLATCIRPTSAAIIDLWRISWRHPNPPHQGNTVRWRAWCGTMKGLYDNESTSLHFQARIFCLASSSRGDQPSLVRQ